MLLCWGLTLQARDICNAAVDITCATLGPCSRSGTEVIILGAKAVEACRYAGWLADRRCWGLLSSSVKRAACQARSRCKSRLRHRGLRLLQRPDTCQTCAAKEYCGGDHGGKTHGKDGAGTMHPASAGDLRDSVRKGLIVDFMERARLATGKCYSLTCMSSLTWALSTSMSMRCSSSNSAASLQGQDDL